MPRQRSRSPLSPTLATESATVCLFILSVGVLKAGLKTETGFCTICDFAHARPIMLSILLVLLPSALDSKKRRLEDLARTAPVPGRAV